MTEGNDPFGDLDESLGDDPAESPADESDGSGDDGTDDQQTDTVETRTSVETTQRTTRDEKERPAFPFDAVKQSALYARDETWDDFEAAMSYEAERSLHEDGYSNIEGRELHEAALLVAAENPELVAERIRELRETAHE